MITPKSDELWLRYTHGFAHVRDLIARCREQEAEILRIKRELEKAVAERNAHKINSSTFLSDLSFVRAEIERWRDSNARLRAEMEHQSQRADEWCWCAQKLHPWAEDALEEMASCGIEYEGQTKCKAALAEFERLKKAP